MNVNALIPLLSGDVVQLSLVLTRVDICRQRYMWGALCVVRVICDYHGQGKAIRLQVGQYSELISIITAVLPQVSLWLVWEIMQITGMPIGIYSALSSFFCRGSQIDANVYIRTFRRQQPDIVTFNRFRLL